MDLAPSRMRPGSVERSGFAERELHVGMQACLTPPEYLCEGGLERLSSGYSNGIEAC